MQRGTDRAARDGELLRQPLLGQALAVPDFAFFADEEQALSKLRAGFQADVAHPCTASTNRWRAAGMIKPIEWARISRWGEIIPQLPRFKGVQADGQTWFMPWDWGYSAIAYRSDLLTLAQPDFGVMLDPASKGKVGMNAQFDVALAVAGEIGGFADLFDPTEAEMERLPDLWRRLIDNTRFLWNDPTEIENAMANGEVTLAYLWGGSVKSLRDQGIPLEIIDPVLTWACGYCLTTGGQGDEGLAYAYLDALLDPAAGQALIDWGYGHANRGSFEQADPALLASLGLGDIEGLFARGKVFDEVPAAKRDRLIGAWAEAQARL